MSMAVGLRPASAQLVRVHRAAWAHRLPNWKPVKGPAGAQRAYRATPVVAAGSFGRQLQVSHILVRGQGVLPLMGAVQISSALHHCRAAPRQVACWKFCQEQQLFATALPSPRSLIACRCLLTRRP